MDINSYSKINLVLKVNSKSKNGLHEIQSLYCWINLSDKITINKLKNGKDVIKFKGPFAKLVNKDNSVLNLLNKMRELKLVSNHYSITIVKNIPVYGGLGGGTSNAAFILKYLIKRKISRNLLKKFINIIGSDLILFFKKQGFLKNLKTIVELKKRQKFYFVLTQPKIKCSSKDIYSSVNKYTKKEKFNKNIIKSKNKFLEYLEKNRNDLQLVVERKYPFFKKLLTDIACERGCSFSRMTGSGSVCYGLFKHKIDAEKALNKLKKKYPKFWFSLAKTV